MTDPVPGTTPVVDHRTPPRGVLPRSTQTWVMGGLAVAIVGIIVIAGHPEPAPRSSTSPSPTTIPALSPDRLKEYQDRLRLLEERAHQQPTPVSPAASAAAEDDTRPRTPASPDPLAEDRRRRTYESLFASNVVMSRRPDGQRLVADSGTPARPFAAGNGDAPVPPSIDAVADAVVRATTRATQATAPVAAATAAAPVATTAPAPPAAATGRSAPPAHTDPISSSGVTQRLLEGTVIDTVLTNRLDGGTAAPVNCLVTNPVYSHDGQRIVIPAGARVLGETKPVQAFGETRVAVAFDRLVMLDGSTYRLDQFAGLNAIGDAGLRDQVNQHYLSTFGAAAAIGLISGFGQYLGTGGFADGTNNTVVIGGGVADATGQAMAQTMNRFLNRMPTVTIREGHRVKVYLTSDIDLPATPVGR
jgi:type IV secretory pathway VirB10-like protein